jgi:hypothetical protein
MCVVVVVLHLEADCDVANGRLPQPPPGQNIYGISKIAEAAGKKMLKLGKSLRKIRTKRNSSDMGVQHKGTSTVKNEIVFHRDL